MKEVLKKVIDTILDNEDAQVAGVAQILVQEVLDELRNSNMIDQATYESIWADYLPTSL